jgi:predicted transcriptional regulator
MSNVQLAKQLGVSDSLISDYCNRVNRQLKTLDLTVEQARVFEAALKHRTARILGTARQQVA